MHINICKRFNNNTPVEIKENVQKRTRVPMHPVTQIEITTLEDVLIVQKFCYYYYFL